MENEKKKLMQLSARCGCAGKFTPDDLAKVLKHIEVDEDKRDPNLLVGFDKSDDAGVYKISDDLALVQTVDFFTPVANDPYTYGQIAAANALSDVYAMGGKPLTALNLSCFSATIGADILAEILKGGADKIREAGATIAGGHTITDEEIKYGVSVTGLVHPDKVISNSGAKVGDVLILTKPLGSGVLTTALKIDFINDEEFEEAAKVMSTLNKIAAEEMQKIGVNSCTDITGFGLIGHSYEMASGSGVALEIDSKKIPIMNKVRDLVKEYCLPSGAYSNEKHFEKWVSFIDNIDDVTRLTFFDPQTSGGLLISVSEDKADELLNNINNRSEIKAAIIGRVIEANQTNKPINII
ncbi:selenide, water dikinase SelD [Clostridium sp. AL.422]|uniref:selenide, water dikinase SelD n=1 Tax=Clostridium TaxID=1485 RepID=UPI00293DF5ED|nr:MULTISPECIES: selenide, water dikinase SelD [unclassified Clostridium]MDV4152706.1 selenide, water dikinase SelD [Clostridium sp. AL.422]